MSEREPPNAEEVGNWLTLQDVRRKYDERFAKITLGRAEEEQSKQDTNLLWIHPNGPRWPWALLTRAGWLFEPEQMESFNKFYELGAREKEPS